jgi:membrane-bound lytic murein transglycosylase D
VRDVHCDAGRRWGGGFQRQLCLLGVRLLTAALFLAPAVGGRAAETEPFPQPVELRPAVRFWVDMFSRYGSEDYVIHDRLEPGRVYEVVHLDDPTDLARVEQRVRAIADRITLRGIWGMGHGPHTLLPPVTSHAPMDPGVDRIRVQRGMREGFAQALAAERLYRPLVAPALAQEGVPASLAVLPLIESSYHPEAESRAGAVGLWQLTADTARRYLRVGGTDDERRDPTRATAAAAQHLRELREALPNWPLAITAYNHGLSGVARARREIGSDDLGVLVARYHGPSFGFASRNYYAEFLAAREIVQHVGRYFPALRPGNVIEYRVKSGDSLYTVAHRHGVTIPALRQTNGLVLSAQLQPGQRLLIRL